MANSFGVNIINLEDDDLEAGPDDEPPLSPVFSSARGRAGGACYPYFPFSDSDSDSGLILFSESRPDPNRSFIDFFDPMPSEFDMAEEFHRDPGSGPSGVGDFNLFGFEDSDVEELGLGLGVQSGSGLSRQDGYSGGGLRVTTIDSDSDYEDGVIDLTSSDNGNIENDLERVEGELGLPATWDAFFAEESLAPDEELEWEEVQNALHGIPSADGDDHNPDWEVLLAVNNAVNYIEETIDLSTDIDPSYYLYLTSANGVHAMNDREYDSAFEEMFDNDSVIRGSPPASKRAVEDLPVVELTIEELSKGDIVCAVCKDEINLEESVRRLPCSHHYHGECIIPWLGIRNTCPVCRYELPTDDPEYERNRRRQRRSNGGGGSAIMPPVRYDSDFEMFA